MAAANEIDQALMDLLTQNIEAAKAAEQVRWLACLGAVVRLLLCWFLERLHLPWPFNGASMHCTEVSP